MNDKGPLKTLSVVIPLYNHERYIKRSIESLLSQTSMPNEIVVVDDGSTDSSLGLAREALSGFANSKIISQANHGAHATINTGITHATSEWISIMNSDDLFGKDKFHNFFSTIQLSPGVEAYFGGVSLIGADDNPLFSGVAFDWLQSAVSMASARGYSMASLCQENFLVTTSNIIFRKSLWRRLGNFSSLRYCHDLEFFLRIMRLGWFTIKPEFLDTQYRVHPENTISEDFTKTQLEFRRVVADHLWNLGISRVSFSEFASTILSLRERKYIGQVMLEYFRRGFFKTSADYFAKN